TPFFTNTFHEHEPVQLTPWVVLTTLSWLQRSRYIFSHSLLLLSNTDQSPLNFSVGLKNFIPNFFILYTLSTSLPITSISFAYLCCSYLLSYLKYMLLFPCNSIY